MSDLEDAILRELKTNRVREVNAYGEGVTLVMLAINVLDAAGFVVVPKVPTDAMYKAGISEMLDGPPVEALNIWGAMVEARPK